MTSFHEVRFPVDISYGSSGGPEYSTDIIITAGGHEQRNINWADARAVYNITHGVKTKEQLASLIDFFRARRGRAYGFRFKDWSDYSASQQNIGTANGTLKDFQLRKHYSSGGEVVIRNVHKIVDNSVIIYVDGIVQNSGYSIDYNSGVISFADAPSDGKIITASFEFDVPVRFDTDRLSASLDDYGVHSWREIPLLELRV